MSLPASNQVFANTVSGRSYNYSNLATSAQATGLLNGGVAPTIAFVCSRVGSNISITFDSVATTKNGANRAFFPAGTIPAEFRPLVNTYAIALRTTGISIAQVLTDGAVELAADATNAAWANGAAVNLFRFTLQYTR